MQLSLFYKSFLFEKKWKLKKKKVLVFTGIQEDDREVTEEVLQVFLQKKI